LCIRADSASIGGEPTASRGVLRGWKIKIVLGDVGTVAKRGRGGIVVSKHEVVDAYLRGRIDRREFVRRLTAIGVSSAAAVAYAQTLSRPAAASQGATDARGYQRAFQADQTPTTYPTQDSDEDGFTDEEEEACGSDPHDPNSTCDTIKTPSAGQTPATLPTTGVPGGGDGDGDRGWLAPVALLGAGAALIGRSLRRTAKTG
jgi:hypothetical protein